MPDLPVREYSCELNLSTAITTQVDIFEILAGTGKPLALLGFSLYQTSEAGDAQEEQLELVLKYVTGAPTSGSGGPTAPTFRPKQPNDTAAGATIEHGNTTKLTGGTSVNLARFSWNVRGELPYVPIGKPHIADSATRFVLELVKTPADQIDKIVGLVEIAELI
jgi:hypothetical protein